MDAAGCIARPHDQRMDDRDMRGGEPLMQIAFAILVHEKTDRAAMHAVDRLAGIHEPLQGRQHEAVAAHVTVIHPLIMRARDAAGRVHRHRAINEVSLFRQSYQAARLRIVVDGNERLAELVADGIMLATPAGSTAYNLSVQGPIIPIGAPLLALTPISPFRPRRWHGALLPDRARVSIEVLEAGKRPVAAVADHDEVRSVRSVDIHMDHATAMHMLFDPGHSLDERIIGEQFGH